MVVLWLYKFVEQDFILIYNYNCHWLAWSLLSQINLHIKQPSVEIFIVPCLQCQGSHGDSKTNLASRDFFFSTAIGYICCEQIILDTDTLYPLSLFYVMISRGFLMFCIYNDIAIGKLRTEFYIYIYVYVYVYFLKSLTVLKIFAVLLNQNRFAIICSHKR